MVEELVEPSADATATRADLPATRAYQEEMLQESKHRNIIIALDTGSGKTLIAVQRIMHELEKESTKISWFFAPTVSLCDQQRAYIAKYVPASVGLVSGANEPDQWKSAALWQRVLNTHRVMVSTPQVFLDALRHGYISLGKDIGLLVFDEAHHAVEKHPYNRIMVEFYSHLPVRTRGNGSGIVRPMVLGLTASPIYGGDIAKAFRTIESNLDSTIRSPRLHRTELAQHVHRPVFKHTTYAPFSPSLGLSTNLAALQTLVGTLDIEQDPYTISLRAALKRHPPGTPEHTRTDQKLSRVVATGDTFTHRGLRQFAGAAEEIYRDVGVWAADWFVWTVLEQAKKAADPFNLSMMATWRETEKKYLLRLLGSVVVSPVSYHEDDIDSEGDVSPKARALMACLLGEKFDVEERAEREGEMEEYSCITFVQRRDTVLALAALLVHHPATKDVFRIGTLLGTSDSSYRHAFMDITRSLVRDTLDETLDAFRNGEKNLIISTAVAEEGIDIQACGSVVRWDLPPNMASWAQSRGRARRRRSTFTLMFEEGGRGREDMGKWEMQERRMVEMYNDPSRGFDVEEEAEELDLGEDDDLFFTVESTGATLTLHSAITHLTHFCAVIPNSSHVDNRPIYDLDPPEFPPGWHAFSAPLEPYTGPYGARVTLPRTLPLPQRVFSVPCTYKTKISAYRHVAYHAYLALWDNGLLNEHLLPITSVVEPEKEEEVREMLREVERRAGMADVGVGVVDPWAPLEPPVEVHEQQEGLEEDTREDQGEDEEKTEEETWYCSELHISGLPSLIIFARTPLLAELSVGGPILYRPAPPTPLSPNQPDYIGHDEGEPSSQPTIQTIYTALTYLGPLSSTGGTIARAQLYTRTLFWALNGSRMQWDDTNFAYLVLPLDKMDTVWEGMRGWHEERLALAQISIPPRPRKDDAEDDQANKGDDKPLELPAHLRLNVSARDFGEAFGYPADVTLVQKQLGFGKPFKFVRWRGADEPLTEEEEEMLRDTYRTRKDKDNEKPEFEIVYPLMVAQAYPPRSNFLVPPVPPKEKKTKVKDKGEPTNDVTQPDVKADTHLDGPYLFTFLPEKSGIILLSPAEAEHAFLLPSILRAMTMSLATHSMRHALFRPLAAPAEDATESPTSSTPQAHTPQLQDIAIPLLQTAITAPSSGERTNYQRLETLGDTVLKFVAGVQLLDEYPLWHEGYLTKKKDHAVSNVRLAKENIKRGVYRWVIRDNMLVKKWKPRYFPLQTALDMRRTSPSPEQTSSSPPAADTTLINDVSSLSLSDAPTANALADVAHSVNLLSTSSQTAHKAEMMDTTEKQVDSVTASVGVDPGVQDAEAVPSNSAEDKPKAKKKKSKKNSNQLSTKVLADVIESTVGAAYLHGSFNLGYECLKYYDLGLKWQPLDQRVEQLLSRVDASLPGPDEPPLHFPRQLEDVERMIGYTFKRKILLIEALTHASYQNETRTPSYERMEFLGDSVLDMIITDFLYHAPGKNYSPGHMHLRKSAVVNAHILAYICLKTSTTIHTSMPRPAVNGKIEVLEEEQSIPLWKCLLHSSQIVLDDQLNTARRFKKCRAEIEEKLAASSMFPWGSLTRLHAPKFLSDMIESVIGAIFLDSEGSLSTVRAVLGGLGIMPLIARIVKDDVDVLHPVSRLSMWASKHEKKIGYTITKSKGRVSCAVVVDGKEEIVAEAHWRGKASEEEVKYTAAETAIEAFKLRHAGSNWESLKKKKVPRPKKSKRKDVTT